MVWLHFTSAPVMIDELFSRDQVAWQETWSHMKPRGFWITVEGEDGWKEWCLANDFYLQHLTHQHEVDLDEARMLIVRTADDLRAFAAKYTVAGPDRGLGMLPDAVIDWQRVASDHGGLIIAPFRYGFHFKQGYDWYHGWDCASGVIWDIGAILDVRLVEIDMSLKKRGEKIERRKARRRQKLLAEKKDAPKEDGGQEKGQHDKLVGAYQFDEPDHGTFLVGGPVANHINRRLKNG